MMGNDSRDDDGVSHRLRVGTLNRSVLEELRQLRSAEDPHFMTRVLSMYLNDSPKLMQQLNAGLAAANAAEIVRTAHALKSTSASIGAEAMNVLCAEVVAAGRAGKVAHARELYEWVEPEHRRVLAALQAELARADGA